MRPAVWQRLPDITPNYGPCERRSKLMSGTRNRESAVLVRDNVSHAHQLDIQLSSLTLEKSRTMRLLDTSRQTFIARQSVKQRHLERAGITDVSLLPPELMLLAAAPTHTAEMTSKLREAKSKRHEKRRQSYEALVHRREVYDTLPENDEEASDYEEESKDWSADGGQRQENAIIEVNRQQKFIRGSPTRLAQSATCAPASILPDVGAQATTRSKSNLTTSFMTHGYAEPHRRNSECSQASSDSTSSTAEVRQTGGRPVLAASKDPRFLSLLSALSRCGIGGDAFVQLSPSGSRVLGVYSRPSCDLDGLRRAIEANRGTARLRYVRAATGLPRPVSRKSSARRRLITAGTDIPQGLSYSSRTNTLRTQAAIGDGGSPYL